MKLFGGTNKKKKQNQSERNGSPDKRISAASAGAGKRKFKLTGLQKGLIILAGTIAVLVLVVVVGWGIFARAPDIGAEPPSLAVSQTPQVTTTTTVDPGTNETMEVTVTIEPTASLLPGDRKRDYFTVLLVGTDDGGGNTDTIMLAGFDVANKMLNVMSIPRDTLIDVNWSYSTAYKINAAYAVGGMGEDGIEYLKGHVENILGIPIDCYALIDLDFFVDLIDIIGGVYFDVPVKMSHIDTTPGHSLYINLSKGEQLLNGDQCMQLVRYRGYTAGDVQRVSTQQDFVKALAKQCLQLKNALKVVDIAKTLSENLTTDMTVGNIAYFGQELLKLDLESIETFTLPGNGMGSWRGLSYYFLYGADVVEMVNEHFNPYVDREITLDDVDIVTIKNGTMIRSTGSGESYVSNYSTSSSASTAKPVSTATPAPTPTPSTEPDDDNNDEIAVPTDDPDPDASGSPQVTGSAASPSIVKPSASVSPDAEASPSAKTSGTIEPSQEPEPSESPAATEPSPVPSSGDVSVPTDEPIS